MSALRSTQLYHVKHCSICGKDHGLMDFTRLAIPVVIDSLTFEYVGTCPTKGELVYARYVPESSE